MMAVISSYDQAYWTALDKQRKEIKGFLKSLRPEMVGGGFVLYDPDRFILTPRSAYLNSPWTQRLVCVLTPEATFDKTQAAFMDLLAKCKTFKEQIEAFKPSRPEDCSAHSKRMLKKLIVIEQLITEVSQPALDQLQKNYQGDGKADNARSLREFGTEIFPILTNVKELFINKLTPHIPTIRDDISLQKFAFSARGILGRREDNIRHIVGIRWAPKTGVVVAPDFISNCLQDAAEKSSTTRGELINAVNHIAYSHQAVEIQAGYGAANWKPLRPVGDGEQVSFAEGGVTGSSERDHKGRSSNLSNVYYLVNMHDMQLVVGCGPIDTKVKAQQLAACLVKAGEVAIGEKKRFVVHQFDTFKTEEYLMTRTPDLIANAEECLKKALGDGISLLHINTALSAASTLASEHDKSFMQINIESLGMIAGYVFEDIEKMFVDSPEMKKVKETDGMKAYSTLLQQVNNVTRLAAQVKADKNAIRSSFSSPVPQEQQQRQMMAESTYFQQNSLEQSQMLPKQTVSDYPNLESSQNQLRSALFDLYAKLGAVIEEINIQIWAYVDPSKEQVQSLFQKSKVLLELLKMNLGCQLKAPNMSTISRCTEIELLLLTYKMLNIHVVHTCRNGLDRGAISKAMFSALSSLEQKCYIKALGSVESETKELIAQVRTYEMLFDVITHQDEMRDKLFTIINSMDSLLSNVIEDLQQLDKPAMTSSLNDLLQEKIKAYCLKKENAGDKGLASRLGYAHLYQELFTVNLLSSEMLKTLFSTGVVGMKWHHDASFLAGEYANFHPLDRLAMFIHLKKDGTSTTPVRLMHYTEGGRLFAKSLKITRAGIQIILRLNQLREG